MTDELFELPPCPSPRLQWIERHSPRIKPSQEALRHCNHTAKDLFCAWFPRNDEYIPSDDADFDDEDPEMEPTGGPDKIQNCGFGDTEDDALRDLCRVTGTKHWSQE